MQKRRIVVLVTTLTLVCLATAVVLIPQLNWRARVALLKAEGRLPDVTTQDLAVMAMPGSPYAIERLAETGNPFAVIKNPQSRPEDIARGRELFFRECSTCHGDHGQGGITAPALDTVISRHGRSDWAIFTTIRDGVPSTAMAPHPYPRGDLWQLVAFLQSLDDTKERTAAVSTANPAAVAAPLPYRTLAETVTSGADWLTYSGSYSGTRHSSLHQITSDNVRRLVPRWVFQFEGGAGTRIEATAIVRSGRMYLSGASGTVVSLDAATGVPFWTFVRKPPDNSLGWVGGINRGVALLGSHVYVGTSDGRLLALSADSGKVIWDAPVAAAGSPHYITAAPLALDGLVIVGTGGGYGRGTIVALDADSGREAWRFHTIPAPGMPGSDSWAGDSWKEGGAAPWMTGSYDPVHDVLYWGVGNPAPDYNTLTRKGDNLYSNSVVALRGTTGKLLWHYQFTPGDDHDWDSAQVPMLVPSPPGDTRSRVLFLNRNGYFYNLDAASGRFAFATAFVKQNWAMGIREDGRPILVERPGDASRGVLTFPSNVGGTNWWPPSYDPRLGYVFVPAIERGQIYFPATAEHDPGPRNSPASSGKPHQTLIKAINARNGTTVWQHAFPERMDREETGGLLSTAGDLVFGSDLHDVLALRSTDGKVLWQFATGGQVSAAPMTYRANGDQYVGIAAGSVFFAFALPATARMQQVATSEHGAQAPGR